LFSSVRGLSQRRRSCRADLNVGGNLAMRDRPIWPVAHNGWPALRSHSDRPSGPLDLLGRLLAGLACGAGLQLSDLLASLAHEFVVGVRMTP
jgi:hypothetical protein